MPDITMCNNEKCPSNDSCRRYIALPNEYLQSYGDFKPPNNWEYCSHYWPVKEEK